jgi:hypothetical protein
LRWKVANDVNDEGECAWDYGTVVHVRALREAKATLDLFAQAFPYFDFDLHILRGAHLSPLAF